MPLPSFFAIFKNPIHLLAFGFGSGLISPASGTWGSLLGGLLILPFINYFNPLSAIIFLLISFLIGVFVCQKTSDYLGMHDHKAIVFDEFLGMWLVLFFMPKILNFPNYLLAVIGFILFRIFDITKPYPINKLDEKINGGLGIMLDDVLAGVYALIIFYLISFMIKN